MSAKYKVIVVETGVEFEIPSPWVYVDALIDSVHTRVLIRKDEDE